MAEIINMPRKQMLGAIRRDPTLNIQIPGRAFHNRSTSEIWNDMMHLPMGGECHERDKLILELQRT